MLVSLRPLVGTSLLVLAAPLFAHAAEADKPAATDATKSAEPNIGQAKEQPWPLSGSVSLGYRFNQANFANTESSQTDLGSQSGSINVGLGYQLNDLLSLDVGAGVSKTLSKSYGGAGSSQTANNATEMGDVSVGLGVGEFYKIPGVGIGLSGGVGASIPTSKGSQASGAVTSLGSSLSAGWSGGGFNLSLGASWDYSIWKNPTVQLECDSARNNCDISGVDTGDPLPLHSVSGSFSVGYKIIKDLSASASYGISNSWLTTTGKDDEFTSQYAQTGTQGGLGSHNFGLGLSYRLLEKTGISARMSTGSGLYNARGSDLTLPLYDFETRTGQRTSYSFGLNQSF